VICQRLFVALYRPADSWEAAASALIDRAFVIVVLVGPEPSPGVEWELDAIVSRNLADRTLVVRTCASDPDWTDVLGRYRHRCTKNELDVALAALSAERGAVGGLSDTE
jgi:hypothetical protein